MVYFYLAFTTVVSFILLPLTTNVTGFVCEALTGNRWVIDLDIAWASFFNTTVVMLLIGSIALGLFPKLFNKTLGTNKMVVRAIVPLLLATVFSLVFTTPEYSLWLFPLTQENKALYGLTPIFYTISAPLIQGALYLNERGDMSTKKRVKRVVFILVFPVVTVLSSYIMVGVFKMGVQGAAYSGAFSSTVLYILAVISVFVKKPVNNA